jgi:hypothetical protein
MNQTKLLADRIKEVFLNGTWIANTNFNDQLSDLNVNQATYKVNTLNTIAALTFHVNYYIAGMLNFLKSGKLEINDKYSFDMPAIKADGDWEKLRNTLLKNAKKFAKLIEIMPDEKLNDVFVDEKYGTYLRNIEGLIEHSYYHLGQIVFIKKIIQSKNVDNS